MKGFTLFALLAVAAPHAAAEPGAAKGRTTKIAVLDVMASGNLDRKTVEGLSSLVASEVARRPSLAVLAGADLKALMGFERQKQMLGCADGACMAELAGALGVAYLVSSEVSRVGSTWLFSLTLLDASKAAAVARLTRRAASDDDLVDQASGAVDELLAALPGLPPPPPRVEYAAVAPRAATQGGAGAGFHEHDGLYLRMLLGGGGLSGKGGGLEASGVSGTFSLALGYSVTDRLVVYGEIYDEVASGPTAKVLGAEPLQGASVTYTAMVYGAGVAWYFQPANAYVSVTVGSGSLSMDVDKTTATTKSGLFGRATVGKEWWVSPNWGLGIAASAGGGSAGAIPGATGSATMYGASVALSATYN